MSDDRLAKIVLHNRPRGGAQENMEGKLKQIGRTDTLVYLKDEEEYGKCLLYIQENGF